MPAMATTIETKLRPPQNANAVLERPELLARLLGAAKKGSTISIVAPAGSGKSTLSTQLFKALEDADFHCHWISLDATNDDPANFALYFTEALATLDPRFAAKQSAVLKANNESSLLACFNAIVTFLSQRTRNLAIFLDDFHNISQPEILAFVARLLTHIPPNICLVMSSRSNIPVDLSRKRMAGTLLEITPTELNFNAPQLRSFLHQMHAIDLTAQDVETLHNTTEGWVAGLQLAALSIATQPHRSSEVIREFSSQDRNLQDYLFQSVLNTQPPEVRDFLLQTSMLSKMSASLCDAVVEGGNSQAMLSAIEQKGLFLIPLDRKRQWFRYHHLFAEFLQNQLDEISADSLAENCKRAASWNVERGYLTEAIQYFLDGGLHERAAELITENATHVALDNGDHATILDWMRRLPREYHDNNPRLLLNHAWSRAFSRDLPAAQSLCAKALEKLEASVHSNDPNIPEEERESLFWFARVIEVLAKVSGDKIQTGVELCSDLLGKLPAAETVLKASIANTQGYCHLVQNDLKATAQDAAAAYQFALQAQSAHTTVWGDFLAGAANVQLGRLCAASESAARATHNATGQNDDNTYIAALAALLSAEIATQRCDFERSNQLITTGKVLSSIYGPMEALLMALRNEARHSAWTGSLGIARRSLQQGQDIGLTTNQDRLFLELAAEEVALQLLFDDVDSAMDTIRRTNLLGFDPHSANPEISANIIELQNLTQARLLLAENKNKEALTILQRLLRSADANQRIALSQHLHALRSIGLWKTGKKTQAMRELDRALARAAPEQHAYPIVSAGCGLSEVLQEIIGRRGHVSQDEPHQVEKRLFETHICRFLRGELAHEAEAPRSAASAATEDSIVAPETYSLTDREIEILRLLGAGLNNQDLSDELLITLSTTKWYLHKIFNKLEVRNRTAAVATARRANLI